MGAMPFVGKASPHGALLQVRAWRIIVKPLMPQVGPTCRWDNVPAR